MADSVLQFHQREKNRQEFDPMENQMKGRREDQRGQMGWFFRTFGINLAPFPQNNLSHPYRRQYLGNRAKAVE